MNRSFGSTKLKKNHLFQENTHNGGQGQGTIEYALSPDNEKYCSVKTLIFVLDILCISNTKISPIYSPYTENTAQVYCPPSPVPLPCSWAVSCGRCAVSYGLWAAFIAEPDFQFFIFNLFWGSTADFARRYAATRDEPRAASWWASRSVTTGLEKVVGERRVVWWWASCSKISKTFFSLRISHLRKELIRTYKYLWGAKNNVVPLRQKWGINTPPSSSAKELANIWPIFFLPRNR